MKSVFHFLKATLLGGIVFLIPMIVLIVVLGKAFEVSRKVVAPLSERIAVESVGGIETPRLLAIAIIVFSCFLAGLLARTNLARQFVRWLESTFLSHLPGYSFMKSLGESMVGMEKEQTLEVVLARIEDAWQIAFLVERIEGGHVALYVPGAPGPWSGCVYFMSDHRIKPLDVPLKSALKCVKSLGMGSNALLRGQL
jgi:uncharacterized membrane protein